MARTKVVVEKAAGWLGNVLLDRLRGESRLKVVVPAKADNVSLMKAAKRCAAHAVVLFLPGSHDVQDVCVQLLDNLPDLQVFAVSLTGARSFHYHRKSVVAAPVRLEAWDDLLSALIASQDR